MAARKPEMPRSVLDDIKKDLVTNHQYPEGLPDLVEVPQSWDRDSTAQFGWKRRGVDVSPEVMVAATYEILEQGKGESAVLLVVRVFVG